MIKVPWTLFWGIGLISCATHLTLHQTQLLQLTSDSKSADETEKIIKPYRDSLSKMMNIHVANASADFIIERPSSNLMNWVADALFVNQTKMVRLTQPAFCLLNFGGLRSTLNKGEILMGDLYKLMPFDNTITWVEIPVSVLPEIAAYLVKTGGEPLANASIVNGEISISSLLPTHTHVWVITSDYLANGGDNMAFFKKGTHYTKKNKTLRDALIEEARYQETLIENTEIRIK